MTVHSDATGELWSKIIRIGTDASVFEQITLSAATHIFCSLDANLQCKSVVDQTAIKTQMSYNYFVLIPRMKGRMPNNPFRHFENRKCCNEKLIELKSCMEYNHPEKQLALLNTPLTDTNVPPHTWLPFFCRLTIHGHVPAVTEFPFKKRKSSGALPQKTSWEAGGQRVTINIQIV